MPQLPHSDDPVSAETEARAKEHYPYREMSPEEYVARRAHLILCFGDWKFKYRDKALESWLQQVYVHLHDRAKREECRERFLSQQERAEFRRIEQEEF